MEIVKYPDPVLRRGGKPIETFDQALRDTAATMLESMYDQKGVGLAAPQVGIELDLMVLNPSGDPKDTKEELVLINPKITSRKGMEWGEEGCLSFPGIYGEIERSKRVVIDYQDLDGNPQQLRLEDFLARIVQHELDHLTGVLFVDRMSTIDKMRVRGKLQELEQAFKQARA